MLDKFCLRPNPKVRITLNYSVPQNDVELNELLCNIYQCAVNSLKKMPEVHMIRLLITSHH
ncbi:hypothetical protein HDE71_000866 [Janthinobacterium sp. S3M3]|nr:hypothetical protein [Janthinobacterium sp. S3T4]MBB5611869.1 hypothetical protein [Janthinobacterium sp. S3M3]